MSSQQSSLNSILSQFMITARQSLAQIITSLQSDQLLEQMRNDQNLYQEKLNYIEELIKHHFVVEPVNSLLVKKVAVLEKEKKEVQMRIQDAKDQYINELSNIEVQYKQFLAEKENQKKYMQNALEQKDHQLFMLKKDMDTQSKNAQHQMDSLNNQVDSLKTQIQTLNKSEQSLRQQIHSLTQSHKAQLQKIQSTKNTTQQSSLQFQSKLSFYEKQNFSLKEILQKQQQQLVILTNNQKQHLETIESMKGDMFLIKEEWQKKCVQIQMQLSQSYRHQLIEHEEQMNSKLKQYMEDLKMGKNIIIQSSQEILQSKKQLIEERFNNELKRYHQDMQHLQDQLKSLNSQFQDLQAKYKQSQQSLIQKQAQITALNQKLQNLERNHQSETLKKDQETTQQIASIKAQLNKQIQRLRKTETMLLKDLKTSKQEKQQIQKQVNAIREDFSSLKSKHSSESKRLKQLQQINQTSNTKILQMKKDLAIMQEKSTMDDRSLKQRMTQINRLENSYLTAKAECKQIDTICRKLQLKLAESNLKAKQTDRVRRQTLHKAQQSYLLVRKLSKQLSLVKQDVAFMIKGEKTKLASFVMAISQEISLREEILKNQYRIKIKQLQAQADEQRMEFRQVIEEMNRDADNMKRQIKNLELALIDKEQQFAFDRDRAVSQQVEKCRLLMQEEITRERDQNRKLSEKLYNQEKKYEYQLSKTEKEVTKNVRSFLAKWESKLATTQKTLQGKQNLLQKTTQALQNSTLQIESLKGSLQSTQQKLTKQQLKYQSLKQQRDKTIDQMMRRLQKQTKHKIALERQLKQIRGEIMKTQTTTNNSPFNNYSFTDRQNTGVYTNGFSVQATQEKLKTKPNNRQKELSQIREMIAKTYKVMEGPDKDSPMHKGKLF